MGITTRPSVQLELSLDDVRLQRVVAPWKGVSPRVLTRAYERFTLKAQAAKNTSGCVDPDQYDLWLPAKKAPWIYQGAPLLKEVSDG